MFIGILKNEIRAWLQCKTHLLQGQLGLCHVVQGADHGGAVKDPGDKGQLVNIRSNIGEAISCTQVCLGLLELGG